MSVLPTEFVKQGSLHSSQLPNMRWLWTDQNERPRLNPALVPSSYLSHMPWISLQCSHTKKYLLRNLPQLFIFTSIYFYIYIYISTFIFLCLFKFIFIYLSIYIFIYFHMYCSNITIYGLSSKELFEEDFTSFLHRCRLRRLSERPLALHAIIQVLVEQQRLAAGWVPRDGGASLAWSNFLGFWCVFDVFFAALEMQKSCLKHD